MFGLSDSNSVVSDLYYATVTHAIWYSFAFENSPDLGFRASIQFTDSLIFTPRPREFLLSQFQWKKLACFMSFLQMTLYDAVLTNFLVISSIFSVKVEAELLVLLLWVSNWVLVVSRPQGYPEILNQWREFQTTLNPRKWKLPLHFFFAENR